MEWGRILTRKQINVICGKNPDNLMWLHRLNKRGEGPPRVKIDGRSDGYPEKPFYEWLHSRLVTPATSQK